MTLLYEDDVEYVVDEQHIRDAFRTGQLTYAPQPAALLRDGDDSGRLLAALADGDLHQRADGNIVLSTVDAVATSRIDRHGNVRVVGAYQPIAATADAVMDALRAGQVSMSAKVRERFDDDTVTAVVERCTRGTAEHSRGDRWVVTAGEDRCVIVTGSSGLFLIGLFPAAPAPEPPAADETTPSWPARLIAKLRRSR